MTSTFRRTAPSLIATLMVAVATPAAALAASTQAAEKRISVAVMDLRSSRSIPPELTHALSVELPREIDALGAFKALSMQDIAQMMAFERIKDSVNCDDVTCLAEIGGAIGADYLVTGNLLLLGESYLFQLQLLNVKQARADARVTREYAGGPKGLFDELRTGVKLLLRDVLAAHSGLLRVGVSEEGATIRIDGSIVGASPLPALSVAGGMHTVAVEKQGFVLFSRDIEVKQNDDVALQAALVPSTEYRNAYSAHACFVRRLAWTGIGAGAATLVVGGALAAVSRTRAKDLRRDLNAYNASDVRTADAYQQLTDRDKALARMDGAAVSLGLLGAALLGTGLTLYLTGDDPQRYDTVAERANDTGAEAPGIQLSLGVLSGMVSVPF